MKKILLMFLSFLFIISLTNISAGLFDGKLSCDTYEMEMYDELSETEGSGMGGYLGAFVNDNGPYDHSVHLGVSENKTVQGYISNNSIVNYTIVKNVTDNNFISYMTTENDTLAEITIENMSYVGCLSHELNGSQSTYNEEIFKTDTEFLKKHMSTIKVK